MSDNPDRTALVFVAIESIWPSTSGKDLGGIYSPSDNSSKNAPREDGPKSAAPKQYFQSGDDSPDALNRGYYLMMPLNIISASASTNVGSSGMNNEFNVTFTLDDLIMVTEDNANKPFLGSSGFIAKVNDLVPDVKTVNSSNDYMYYDYLNMSKGAGATVSNTGAEYINYRKLDSKGRLEGDSPLNLSRFRIRGGQSMFSIEDLVMPMDTVTMWMYHDPKEFMVPDTYRDKIKLDDTNGFSNLREFRHIFGSGDRRRQFISDRSNKYNTLLEDSGLSNIYAEDAIKDAKSNKPISFDNVLDQSAVKKAAIGIAGASQAYVPQGAQFVVSSIDVINNPDDSANPKDYVSDYIGLDVYAADTLPSAKGTYKYVEKAVLAGGKQVEGQHNPASQAMVYFMKVMHTNPTLLDVDIYSASGKKAVKKATFKGSPVDENKFYAGYKILQSDLYKVMQSRSKDMAATTYVTAVNDYYAASRKMLATEAHCETPYLVMKGHVRNIVSDWSSTGGYTVTISGSGLEYPLEKNKPFYNDTIFNDAAQNDVMVSMTMNYSYISPARMISHLVWRWAPNTIKIGSPSQAASLFNLIIQNPTKTAQYVLLGGYSIAVPLSNQDVSAAGNKYQQISASRLFTPINYIDLNRVAESARVYEKAGAGKDLQLINKAGVVSPQASILSNMRSLATAGNMHEVWVDESGKVRHRLNFEVWERTPNPKYTPTLENEDIIRARFTRSDEEVITVQDVTPYTSNTAGASDLLINSARALPRLSSVPFDSGLEMNEKLATLTADTTSAALYRYGLRHSAIEDIYGADIESAKPKAFALLRFFGSPLKKAEVTTFNNTSYRAGETVLVNLSKASHRSNVAINVEYMLNWFRALKSDKKLREMVIGVDERLFMMKDVKLGLSLDTVIESNSDFVQKPKEFVLDAMIATLKWLLDNKFKVITPEYFPTTLWYYLLNSGKGGKRGSVFKAPGGAVVPGQTIIDLHLLSLRLALQVGNSNDNKKLVAIYSKYPTAVHALEFMNYVFRSYYINSVSHSYSFGDSFQTSLSLTHGQDYLAIRDPKSNLVLGFTSAERKIKEKYPDPLEEAEVGKLWKGVYSQQWVEDNDFKDSSFMYQAQAYRNSSNYALKLAKKLNKGEF